MGRRIKKMVLKDELIELKNMEFEERCVLSLYLNTNPADPEQRNGAWKIHLKSGMKRLAEYLDASNDEEEIKLFKKTKEKVMKEIDANQNDFNKGVVIFAAEPSKLWSVHYVQVAVKTSFHWENHPVLEELYYMNKAYPNSGIILPGQNAVRIIDTSMGFVNEELNYEFDAGKKQWEQKGEHIIGGLQSSGAVDADAFDDRLKENLLRFYKDMGATVDRLKKERKWEEIHVSGEAELANSFAQTLQVKPESCLHKNLNNRKADIVLQEVFEK